MSLHAKLCSGTTNFLITSHGEAVLGFDTRTTRSNNGCISRERIFAGSFLFRLMRSERIKPSCVTLCSLVRAYGLAGKPEKIEGVLRFVENSDVMLDTVFFNCLVDAYGRMGCFAEMKGVLEIMEQKGCTPDKVTYRTRIKAYSANKMIGHVKELRELMESAEGSQMTWSQKEKPDFR